MHAFWTKHQISYLAHVFRYLELHSIFQPVKQEGFNDTLQIIKLFPNVLDQFVFLNFLFQLLHEFSKLFLLYFYCRSSPLMYIFKKNFDFQDTIIWIIVLPKIYWVFFIQNSFINVGKLMG